MTNEPPATRAGRRRFPGPSAGSTPTDLDADWLKPTGPKPTDSKPTDSKRRNVLVRELISDQRARIRAQLTTGHVDVLVIGGGIVGLATAWESARAGLRGGVIEKGDLAPAAPN